MNSNLGNRFEINFILSFSWINIKWNNFIHTNPEFDYSSSCNLQMFRSTIPACLLVQSQCTLKVLREPYRAPESLNLIFTGGKQDWISTFKETRLLHRHFPWKGLRYFWFRTYSQKQWIIQKKSEKYNLYEWSQILFPI